jgi:hypothetical protein
MKRKRHKYFRVPAVECLACGMYLVSLSRHDYRACDCGSMVDGGPYSGYYRIAKSHKGVRDLNLFVKSAIK